MKQPRKRIVQQRERVFLGCEGESERSYGALLKRLLEDIHRDIHLDAVLLRGGDPLKLVETAVKHVDRSEQVKGEPAYKFKAILLDSDRLGADPLRDKRAKELASTASISLIWQIPCHEALLLKHISGRERTHPATPEQALALLCREWSNYEKAMPANQLAQKITHADVVRTAQVTESLRAFLQQIRFI